MNQAFSLSIGMGSMMIFGSYIDKSRTLLGESINIALLDTFVAIIAGLITYFRHALLSTLNPTAVQALYS